MHDGRRAELELDSVHVAQRGADGQVQCVAFIAEANGIFLHLLFVEGEAFLDARDSDVFGVVDLLHLKLWCG